MKIFISYRREGTQHLVGRLAERLRDTPGVSDVFTDVESISAGMDFAHATDEALGDSHICVAVIGEDWIGAKPDGTMRICDEGDYMRREIALALPSNTRVLPLLVDGAVMPPSNVLPPDVRPIATIDAVSLRHTSFSQDFLVLADAIFQRRPPSPIRRFFTRHPWLTLCLKSLGGVAVAAVLLVILAGIHSGITDGRALNETLGSSGLVTLIISLTLISGAAVHLIQSFRQ